MQRIAIVGIGGLFPSSDISSNPQDHLTGFWQDIQSGRDCSRQIPDDRWLLGTEDAWASEWAADKVNSVSGCFLDSLPLDVAGFDLDKDVLAGLDPLFHILLQAGRQAWQDAYRGNIDKQRTGVIIGNIVLPTDASSALADDILGPAFESQLLGKPVAKANQTESLNRYVAGLPAGILAKALGLGGGSYTLDAACASSLYALKYAGDELIAGRVDAMLAGGVSRPDCLYTQMGFSALGAISKTGRCSPFAEQADGLVVGEGAGIVVLKRLQDALRDKDHIYATIAGIGLANDIGGHLMAPDSEGQLRAMRAAYQQATWSPNDIDLIECHGTGTPVGDAVEYQSLRTLWSEYTADQQGCVMGSVKSNIGHLLTAAGAAGLIKVLLAMKHQQLPPQANFVHAAENIDLQASPFRILRQAETWDKRTPETPRRAAISAFGFGGINAHVLLEEWQQQSSVVSGEQQAEVPDIAIVGMEAQFGLWRSLTAFREHIFDDQQAMQPQIAADWWGVDSHDIKGWFIDEFEIPLNRYRIPPAELKEMLPQQLLMLEVASNAMEDADIKHLSKPAGDSTGVFIGIGLDLNTTNFHFRWSLLNRAKIWAEQLAMELDDQAMTNWLHCLRESAGPALNANRTMGALGGIVASRIARHLSVGGPSFTLSSEESSGLRALEMGVRTLQTGELDMTIVGAVDLAGDVRATLAQHARRPYTEHTLVGEGAAALVLKRYADAKRDGDRVYALIKGIGAANGGGADRLVPTKDAYQKAFGMACKDADTELSKITLFETHGSGYQHEDSMEAAALNELFEQRDVESVPCTLGSVKSAIGHVGAAAGLASIVKSSLCLYHRTLPRSGQRPLFSQVRTQVDGYKQLLLLDRSQYWLRNRVQGRRQASVSAFSVDGNCLHAILEEAESPAPYGIEKTQQTLFALYAQSREGLLQQVAQFSEQLHKQQNLNILARSWWQENNQQQAFSAAIVAADPQQLSEAVDKLQQAIEQSQLVRDDGIYFSPQALANEGKLAFVYPGTGNYFPGMGLDLARQWPQVLERLDLENEALAAQFANGSFWHTKIGAPFKPAEMIFGQAWLATFVSDVITQFNIAPDAVIGYSLGETSGLFATRTWVARDEMMRRVHQFDLFTKALAGPYHAVRDRWQLDTTASVDWITGIINRSADEVKQKLSANVAPYPRAYLLIINTLDECVIGGDREAVLQLVTDLQGSFNLVPDGIAVHCEVVKEVQAAYRELHLLDTQAPEDITFYSGHFGKAYEVTRENVADAIVGQAVQAFDYTQVIKSAYADGIRLFIEMGPGRSCSKMIANILNHQPHIAMSVCVKEQDNVVNVLHCLGHLIAEHVPLDTGILYQAEQQPTQVIKSPEAITVTTGAPCFDIPPQPLPQPKVTHDADSDQAYRDSLDTTQTAIILPDAGDRVWSRQAVIEQIKLTEAAKAATQETFLRFSNSISTTLLQAFNMQMSLLQSPATATQVIGKSILFDREMCMQIATGSIAKVLGKQFTDVDHYPSRVRLPDEPLMLVDRILEINGQADALVMAPEASGSIVTEHDILPDSWYLDGACIPICIAVEAGQADLFLSGYLGIDHLTKGLAFYRLLDAKIVFHDVLPKSGEIIRYDIHIDEFFQQDATYLFRFNFTGTVDGRPLLSMTQGCAGFFTRQQLLDGQGIVQTELEQRRQIGKVAEGWQTPVAMQVESYDEQQLNALRRGDLAQCFGAAFAKLNLHKPVGLPSGRMVLVHRILSLDPNAGRFGIGQITGEADIHPDDWFLTCHFSDDQVMPGTLMYECCLHTLRIYLLRMGWVGEAADVVYQPIIGEISQLKCRGQVTELNKQVQYEITLKEIGYRGGDGTPYVLADALMYADGKPIVQINNMSLQLDGLNKQKVAHYWQPAEQTNVTRKQVLFDFDSIHTFATGKPSEAFGDRYKIFDEQRRIARLPRPPYQLIDRITLIENCQQWQLNAGGIIEAEYDIPQDAWYFSKNRQTRMPYAILLEVALQPCGWLAAYLGSALTSDIDLSFRNLGGSGLQLMPVTAATGTLTTRIEITKVSQSGGMIIQHYDLEVRCDAGMVYKGDTYFGFFSKQALLDQVGIRGVELYQPDAASYERSLSFPYPDTAPYPEQDMRMIDDISVLDPLGGTNGLGFIRGTTAVAPDAWFFKAHFYQDPVWPGSLGLESFLQLLKVFAVARWGEQKYLQQYEFETIALDRNHQWSYRGQIIPQDKEVTVEAVITVTDPKLRLLEADGFLTVDGRIIYQMSNFTLRMIGP